ncbi:MAG TPA: hypothetical protein VFF94_15250, partial [Novosphingobium sp.]|nr:hypothetical protein [Novosphingobium sp.]
GLEVAIPPMLLVHAGAEGSARVLWRQHLRWAATVRDLAGAGHYGSVVSHALALALLAAPCVAVAGLPAAWGAGLVAAALAVRLALAGDVARRMKRLDGAEQLPFWLLPVADIFAFAVFLASWSARKIDWRGLPLTITGSGRIAHSGAPSND